MSLPEWLGHMGRVEQGLLAICAATLLIAGVFPPASPAQAHALRLCQTSAFAIAATLLLVCWLRP